MENRTKEAVIWNTLPPLPDGTKPLDHQVAGHVFGRSNGLNKNQLGFLQDSTGCILKPVQGDIKGLREVRFYQFMNKDFEDDMQHKKCILEYLNDECSQSQIKPSICVVTDEICKQMRRLKDFVPKFYCLWTTNVHVGVPYLKLENVTQSMRTPCVMDVKVGRVTYDKFADEEKMQRELLKCPALNDLGFQLIGIKVFSHKIKDYQVLERNFLRSLDQNNILDQGLRVFFTDHGKLGQSLLMVFLDRLQAILSWFEHQTILNFIASSLLFVYDARLFSDGIIDDGGNRSNYDIKYGGDDGGNSGNYDTKHGGDDGGNSGNYDTKYCSDDGGVNNTEGVDQDCLETNMNRSTSDYVARAPTAPYTDGDYDRAVERMIDLRMIDFTHVFPAENAEDKNYLDGLKSLIGYLKQLVDREDH